MKIKLIFTALISVMLITAFTACGFFVTGDDLTTAPDEETAEATVDASSENATEETEETTEEATEEIEYDLTEEDNGEYDEPSETVTGNKPVTPAITSGYTEKGFEVTVVDGITYVGGILIANKSYALPADYAPGDLLPECQEAFNKMQSVAYDEGHVLYNSSGYRSYELQESLYNRYCNNDGKAAADRYSARPGHSEHQTGLAIDLNEISSSFANTSAGKWVASHCHEYGFIIRYPEGKEGITGYMYEPWHIRYIGVDMATAVYNSGLTLEEYLGITSEYQY